MPVVEDVLREELERLKKKEVAYVEKLITLPKGSLQVKKIKGRAYHYLAYRQKG